MRRPVLVSTSQKFLIFGWIEHDQPLEEPYIVIYDSQLVVYFSAETKGLWGLAAAGPAAGSRVSAPVPRTLIKDALAVLYCTPDAASEFRSVTWE